MNRRTFLSASLAVLASPAIGMPEAEARERDDFMERLREIKRRQTRMLIYKLATGVLLVAHLAIRWRRRRR